MPREVKITVEKCYCSGIANPQGLWTIEGKDKKGNHYIHHTEWFDDMGPNYTYGDEITVPASAKAKPR